jgi:hypothetical protein
MVAKAKNVSLEQPVLDRLEQELRTRAVAEGTNLFPELNELSSGTVVDDIDIDEGSLEVTKETNGDLHINGVVNVYVTLNYGDKKDPSSHGDSFPGHFSAVIAGLDIRLEETTVDTSSFYQ